MKNEYLIIEDEHIIKKLEELLWFDEININSKVDAMLLIEYLNNNHKVFKRTSLHIL